MRTPVISEFVLDGRSTELPDQTYPAVLFRNRVYVSAPHHMDAIRLAFANMTELQRHAVCDRIADGKETMLFGRAKSDGTDWQHDERWQKTREIMYNLT